MKILSIDDSKAVQSFLKSCLSDQQIEWILAENGQVGLDLVKSGKEFDIVILDWEMPVMTGPEFFAEYKKGGYNKPVIMLTSKNSPEDLQKMLDAGVFDYVMKPFTKDIIVQKIQSAVGT